MVAAAPAWRCAASAAPRSTSKIMSPFRRKNVPSPSVPCALRPPPPVPRICFSSRETPRSMPRSAAIARAPCSIAGPRWCVLITISRTPAFFSSAKLYRSSGTPQSGTSGLGILSVRGRSRVPKPAHSTIAFTLLQRRGGVFRRAPEPAHQRPDPTLQQRHQPHVEEAPLEEEEKGQGEVDALVQREPDGAGQVGPQGQLQKRLRGE